MKPNPNLWLPLASSNLLAVAICHTAASTRLCRSYSNAATLLSFPSFHSSHNLQSDLLPLLLRPDGRARHTRLLLLGSYHSYANERERRAIGSLRLQMSTATITCKYWESYVLYVQLLILMINYLVFKKK